MSEFFHAVILKNIIEHSILELASGEGHAMIFALRYLDYTVGLLYSPFTNFRIKREY
jgi:hypothetical protein